MERERVEVFYWQSTMQFESSLFRLVGTGVPQFSFPLFFSYSMLVDTIIQTIPTEHSFSTAWVLLSNNIRDWMLSKNLWLESKVYSPLLTKSPAENYILFPLSYSCRRRKKRRKTKKFSVSSRDQECKKLVKTMLFSISRNATPINNLESIEYFLPKDCFLFNVNISDIFWDILSKKKDVGV